MKYIKTELDGHVFKIALNRPEKMNAFSYQMLQELSEAYTILEETKSARVGYLYAEGDHFTSGLDLADVSKQIQAGKKLFGEDKIDPLQIFDQSRKKPVVIAVHGFCLTIGIEMILANDICVAETNTTFGQIEVQRGIFPFGGATLRFHQRCGWGNAMKYLLTGDRFDAKEALRIGLVQETSADARTRGLELARLISEQAPLAVQATLSSCKSALLEGHEKAIDDLMPTLHSLMKTNDAREGLQSFLERRKANFEGK